MRMTFLSDELHGVLASFYRRRYPDFRLELEVAAIELVKLVLDSKKNPNPVPMVTVEILPDNFHHRNRPVRTVKAVCVTNQFQETGTDYTEVVAMEIDGVTIGTMPSTLPGAEIIAALAIEEVARA